MSTLNHEVATLVIFAKQTLPHSEPYPVPRNLIGQFLGEHIVPCLGELVSELGGEHRLVLHDPKQRPNLFSLLVSLLSMHLS